MQFGFHSFAFRMNIYNHYTATPVRFPSSLTILSARSFLLLTSSTCASSTFNGETPCPAAVGGVKLNPGTSVVNALVVGRLETFAGEGKYESSPRRQGKEGGESIVVDGGVT